MTVTSAKFMRLVCLAALGVLAALVGAQPYVVNHFDSTMTLDRSGRLDVTERIEVTFNEERRGIIRFIPTEYETRYGTNRRMDLTNISVADGAGGSLQVHVSQQGINRVIRIGDPNVYLPAGTKMTYVISYVAGDVVNWFPAGEDFEPSAELYWNVTGNEWDTTIERVTFMLNYPQVEGATGVAARVFSGPYGSTDQDTVLQPGVDLRGRNTRTELTLTDSAFAGVRTAPLPPNSGLTIVLRMPEAFIAKPAPITVFLRVLRSNLGFGIPLVVIAVLGFLWLRFGRDPWAVSLGARFEPPDNLSGPECGALIDERVDQRDLASGIFSLAIKGYLRIHPQETGLIFKRQTARLEMLERPAGPELTQFERDLLSKLNTAGPMVDSSDLSEQVAPYVPSLRETLYRQMVWHGYYKVSPNEARLYWAIGGLVGIALLFFLTLAMHPYHQPLPSIVGSILGAIILAFFVPIMPRRTEKGAKAAQEVIAFAKFIRTGERRRDWLTEKHPDTALFEEYLPHAIAFGLTEKWAKMFDGIVMEAPSWYVSHYPGAFHPLWLAADLNIMSQSLGAAATTPPRSSGAGGGGSGFSSGGGFSGGGFGGGGGSSW